MNPFVMHFASGTSFFTGIGLLLAGVATSFFEARLTVKILARCLILLGMGCMLLSSTPTPMSADYVITALAVAFLILLHLTRPRGRMFSIGVGGALGAVCVLAMLIEVSHWRVPKVSASEFRQLYVIGDSLSAGVGFKGEKTWTGILRERYRIDIVAMTVGGATVGSCLDYPAKINEEKAFVLLEIGGNDVFRGTPLREFEGSLDELLRRLSGPGRRVVMLELPLPPFSAGYGGIQRRLAAKHKVVLAPKKAFAKVLTGSDSTVDGLHLSNHGQEKMADMIWGMVSPAFNKEATKGGGGE